MSLPVEVDVRELTFTMFESIVGLPVFADDVATSAPQLTSSVTISGAWEGSVRIELGKRLARRLAAAMFETSDPAPTDVVDALGELANVLGGNVKSLLPGPSQLSLPKVAAAAREGAGAREPAVHECRLSFVCEGDSFTVSIATKH